MPSIATLAACLAVGACRQGRVLPGDIGRAQAHVSAGLFDRAREELVAARPQSAEDWLTVADAWLQVPGHEAQAARALAQAASSRQPEIVLAAARAAIAADLLDEAETWLRSLVDEGSPSFEALAEYTNLLSRLGRSAEAIAVLAPRAGTDPQLLYLLGSTTLHAGRTQEGRVFLERAIASTVASGRDSAAPRYQLGLALATLGEDGAALEQYERCVALSPDHLAAHYQMLVIAERRGLADVAARARAEFGRLNQQRLAADGLLEEQDAKPRIDRSSNMERRKVVATSSFQRDAPSGSALEVACLPPPGGHARFVIATSAGQELLDVVLGSGDERASWHPLRVQVPDGVRGSRVNLAFSIRSASPLGGLLSREAPAGAAFAEPFVLSDPTSGSTARRPNIVLISLDTMRGDRLGSAGAGRPTSPAIDALAATGLRAARAEAAASWTLPSHYTMLSGLSPAAHGVVPDLGLVEGFSVPSRRLPVKGSGREVMLAEALSAAGYRTSAVTEHGWLAPEFGFDQGFSVYRASREGSAPDTVEHALAEIDVAGANAPWFLFVHTYAPHQPYHAPVQYRSRFTPPGHVGFAHPEARVPMTDYLRFRSPHFPPSRADVGAFLALHDGQVAWCDDLVGRLVRHLETAGLRENTIIAVTSDHGEEIFERGQFDHGDTLHEEVTHVPLVISAPGRVPEGTTIGGIVSLVDLPATLLDLAGVADLLGQGRSLRPQWEGAEPPGARPAFARVIGKRSEPVDAAWSWPLKLIRRESASGLDEQLFDLSSDPGESRDLAASRPADAARMAALLDEHLRSSEEIRSVLGTSNEALDPATLEQLRSLGYVQ